MRRWILGLLLVSCHLQSVELISFEEFQSWEKPHLLYDARSAKDYHLGHLIGAISFPVSSTYNNRNGVLFARSITDMTQTLQDKGVQADVAIVIYDDSSLLDASRLAWVLELYGLRNIHLINDVNLPDKLASKQATASLPSEYLPTLNPDVLANARMTQLAGLNGGFGIVDNRPRSHFVGEQSHTDKFGHVPGAVNVPKDEFYRLNAEGQTVLKPLNELVALFDDFDRDKQYITYCYRGKASTLGFFLMQQAGLKVMHYDGSWFDWSQRDLPVAK
ncbi:sulfurtransferase [Ferrimonas aestuarii]|nr:rhodanese-like domain-containing protein [Ferrimonas aestuarii]